MPLGVWVRVPPALRLINIDNSGGGGQRRLPFQRKIRINTPSIVWLKNGRFLRQVEDTTSIIPALPKKVFNMCYDPDRREIYLEEFADEFHFDFKIYGMESKLIEHVMRTFENTTSNLGMLFNGIKGTGKTITAKIIANRTNLPVILINAPYPGLAEFIAKIACPCVLFFDEFEKNFDTNRKEDVDLLSIMDGVFNSPHRRVFILTTNKLYVNENLLGRPSRIRYRKSFGNLSPEVIQEYLEDNLKNKEFAPEILEFIDTLSISTIDILKSVVDEVNIHDASINDFKHFLNVEQAKYSYMTEFYTDDEEVMTVDKFKELFSKVGTKEKDEDGDEYTVTKSHLGIYSRRINTSMSIDFLQVGEDLGGWGRIVEPLNKDGIIVTETDYGEKRYFKVLNLENKPSLYRGGLAF